MSFLVTVVVVAFVSFGALPFFLCHYFWENDWPNYDDEIDDDCPQADDDDDDNDDNDDGDAGAADDGDILLPVCRHYRFVVVFCCRWLRSIL